MIPIPWWRPVFENPHQPPIRDKGKRHIFGDECEAKTIGGGEDRLVGGIEGKLSVHPNADFATVLLEVPDPESAECRQTLVYAGVANQILRWSGGGLFAK